MLVDDDEDDGEDGTGSGNDGEPADDAEVGTSSRHIDIKSLPSRLPHMPTKGPLIDLATALAIANQFSKSSKRSKRARSPTSDRSSTHSSDSDEDTGGNRHRPTRSKEHALAYFLDNMEGVKPDAPSISLQPATFWPPIPSKPDEHEAARRGRLSGYATLSVTTRSKDKHGKSVFQVR